MVRGEFMLESNAEWHFLDQEDQPSALDMKELPIQSPIVKKLLYNRGLRTAEEIERFLHPNLEDLSDPLLLDMLEEAGDRIKQAIENKQKILVFGDYDADGMTATALLLQTLNTLGGVCYYYIPHRIKEGYGLNEEAIIKAYEQGYELIITVDTGIASFQEAELAKNLGIDLIITDHHEIQEDIPKAYAVVNPKCSKEAFQDLSGVGVAFKLAEYLLGEQPQHLLDLVAIGTIADLVPLTGENRILVHYGLQKLSQTKNLGLQALKEVCQIDDHVTEEQVGFLIGPRMNAVGRIDDAKKVIELLMAEDIETARKLAKEIDQINRKRQELVRTILKEAEEMINKAPESDLIMIAKKDWHEGVLGIVASRLVQTYGKPAIVLTIDEEDHRMKGSGRSIPAFHLFNACMNFRDLFTHFGGHAQAAGMTFPKENFEKIYDQLSKIIQEELSEEDFKQVITVDDSLTLADLNEELYEEIRLLAPFGNNHREPIFHLRATPTDIRQVGRMNDHLKFQFRHQQAKVDAIGFHFGHLYPLISNEAEVSIVGKFQMNEWNGFKTPQILIEDLAIKEWQLFDHRGKKNIDLDPYLSHYENNVVIKENHDQEKNDHVKYITYGDNISQMEIDALYIFDLPTSLKQLKELLQRLQPNNIHLCMCLEEGAFLKPFPTREDFKWLYALIYKFKEIQLKEDLPKMMKAKNWSKDMILFMFHIFAELDFVVMDQRKVTFKQDPIKRDLEESTLYQKRLKQQEVEKVLYYSTYASLREWFSKELRDESMSSSKEEIAHGL